MYIHQMWLDPHTRTNTEPPPQYQAVCRSWTRFNPSCTYLFWNRQRVETLLHYYPHYKRFYDILNEPIERCDFARYFVLALFGGYYFDMKFECLEPLMKIANNTLGVVCNLYDSTATTALGALLGKNKCYDNSVLMSSVSSTFWFGLLDCIIQNYNSKNSVFENTGPHRFTQYTNSQTVHIHKFIMLGRKKGWRQYGAFQCNPRLSSRWYFDFEVLWKLIKFYVRQFDDIKWLLVCIFVLIVGWLYKK